MTKFKPDTSNSILTKLGVKQGKIFIGDNEYGTPVWTLKYGKHILQHYQHNGQITIDQAQKIEEGLTKAGLVENMTGIVEKINIYDASKKFSLSCQLGFCQILNTPLRFVFVVSENSGKIISPIQTIQSGLMLFEQEVRMGTFQIPEAIHLLKLMVRIGIPTDNKDFEEQLEKLPEQKRRIYQETLNKYMVA